jgi:DNA invertase Pin-like site-specific DNA recombinase
MLTILVSYAQEESLSVSENCKWYWRQRMKEGHMVGLRRMFGYSIERGAITVNPTEAAIVRSIFEQYVSGGSTVGIARALEASGVPTVSGGKWNDSRVRDILKNEKYMGNALLQKKYVADH